MGEATALSVIELGTDALFTVKVCWTWGAALKLALPAWLASRTQEPVLWKLTTPAVMVQMPLLEASTLMVTAKFEVAVAAGVYVGPPTKAPVGAGEVKVIVWLLLLASANVAGVSPVAEAVTV
jgi:hypothetical protein